MGRETGRAELGSRSTRSARRLIVQGTVKPSLWRHGSIAMRPVLYAQSVTDRSRMEPRLPTCNNGTHTARHHRPLNESNPSKATVTDRSRNCSSCTADRGSCWHVWNRKSLVLVRSRCQLLRSAVAPVHGLRIPRGCDISQFHRLLGTSTWDRFVAACISEMAATARNCRWKL